MESSPSTSKLSRIDFVKPQKPQTRICPFCAETIQARAIKCRYCGEFLNNDRARAVQAGLNSTISDQPPEILFEARPSLFVLSGTIIRSAIILAIASFLMTVKLETHLGRISNLQITPAQIADFAHYRFLAGFVLAAIAILTVVSKALSLKSFHYEITTDRIEFGRGILNRKVNNIDMFRIIDLRMHQNLFDRILGIGTVIVLTTDKTDPEFTFEKLHKPRRLYDCIKKFSLKADQKQGVIHLE